MSAVEKDYVLVVKVKNAPMLRAMRRAGFQNAAQLSRVCQVSQSEIGRFLNLRTAPLSVNGWRTSVQQIAAALSCLPEDLFPPQHFEKALAINSGEAEVSAEEVAALLPPAGDPQLLLEAAEGHRILDEAIGALPEREARVLRQRFGLDGEAPKTSREIGESEGVTGACIRQVEARALSRIKRRSPQLAAYVS